MDPADGLFIWMGNRMSIAQWHGKQPITFPFIFPSNIQTVNQSDLLDWNGIFNYHTDQVGPFQLNIQCRSRQVRLIRIEYSVAILIWWAHSALDIQCSSRHVRLIGIDYLVIILIGWAHSSSIFNAGPDRLG